MTTSAQHKWSGQDKTFMALQDLIPARASRRINWRMVLAATIVLCLIGVPAYNCVKFSVTGGISRRGDLTEVDLKSMSDFEIDPIAGTTRDVPRRFRELDGKRVLLSGEIYSPLSAADRVSGFDLVYSISKCCVGSQPKVQHFVKSRVKGGGTVDYYAGRVDVTGTLHVGVEEADGQVQSVYRLDVERVDPH
jgi:hypothetical protein